MRSWGGEEFGLKDLSDSERQQVHEDDVLLWRFLFLWMVVTSSTTSGPALGATGQPQALHATMRVAMGHL